MPRGCVMGFVAALCAVGSFAPSLRAGGSGPCGVDFSYPGSFTLGNFDARGSAMDLANALVLTTNAQGQAGAIWHRQGRASLLNGFETTFEFVLDGTADGIAFVLQSNDFTQLGSGGSGMGYAGIPNALAIEIDTFCFNDEFGCDHVSIQTSGNDPLDPSDATSLAHAVLPVDVNDNAVHSLRIVYLPGTMWVFFDGDTNPIFVASLDLTNLNGGSIADPNGCAFMGFTGGTGAASATQQITSWTFNDSPDLPPPGCGAAFDFTSFTNPAQFSLVGDADITAGELVLTTATESQASAAWYRIARASVQESFITEFTFVLSDEADGIAFVMQSDSLNALGGSGSDMGYAGIPNSVAFEIDTFCFGDEFACDHISIQSRGPDANSSDDDFSITNLTLSNDLNDNLPHVMRIEWNPGSILMSVDGEGLGTGFSFNNLNIVDPDGCLFIGFTGATGGATAVQKILSWSMGPGATCEPATADFIDGPTGIVSAPDSIVMTLNHSGTGPFTYEWYHDSVLLVDGANISGATTATITIDPTNTHASGQYDAVVFNDCGSSGTGLFVDVQADCPGDADGNGAVNFADVTNVLANFLGDYGPGTGMGDANADGIVNFADITSVLSNFGLVCV